MEEEKVTKEECQQHTKEDHSVAYSSQYDPEILSLLQGYIKRCSSDLCNSGAKTVDEELKLLECIQKTMDIIERMNQ